MCFPHSFSAQTVSNEFQDKGTVFLIGEITVHGISEFSQIEIIALPQSSKAKVADTEPKSKKKKPLASINNDIIKSPKKYAVIIQANLLFSSSPSDTDFSSSNTLSSKYTLNGPTFKGQSIYIQSFSSRIRSHVYYSKNFAAKHLSVKDFFFVGDRIRPPPGV